VPEPPPLIENDEVHVVKWDPIGRDLTIVNRPRLVLSIRTQYKEYVEAGKQPVTAPIRTGGKYVSTTIPETVVDIVVKQDVEDAKLNALEHLNAAKDRWEYIDGLDPSQADPKHFVFGYLGGDAFDLELRLPAGESTPLVERNMNRVLVYMTDQNVRVTDGAGNVTLVQHKAGDVEWAGPARQSLTNLGKDLWVESVEFPINAANHANPAPPARQSTSPSESETDKRKPRHGRARKDRD
jgi:hypothetical protein